MTEARWAQVKALFEAAVEQPASERSAFVSAAVAGDDTLRREVEALLAADSTPEEISEQWPAASVSLLAGLRLGLSASGPGAPPSPGLAVGSRLGNYDVVAPLGAGGMGEVYRARDARLGRDVAIKILPRAFTSDRDRLARFEREARMLASLNHPHIAGIYGIEDTGTAPALVLELVEGPTLAERISAGRLGIEEVLAIGRQMADALSAAHDKGIVHRDLKPANVKLTPSGVVKVLDFGLAKPAADVAAPELAHSPTITVAGTREGLIFGTAAYMSPEQARGKSVDKRSDIWAFGCVLYEMLTGRKAFEGETVSDTLAAILEREPNWKLLPAVTPASVRRLLQRCLEKDVGRRLRDIGDASLELDDAIDRSGGRSLPGRFFDVGRGRRFVLVVGMVAVCAAFLAGLLWRTPGVPSGAREPARIDVTQITSQSGVEWFPSLSPDGKWVVYGGDTEGNRDIFLQGTTGQNLFNLTKDSPDDDDQPAYSPDGERIAFRSSRDGGGLFVMGRTGEAVTRLTRRGYKPTWSPDGREIAFTTENADLDTQNTLGLSSLWVINMAGEQRQLGNVDAVLPSWSPNGHRIAYTTRGTIAGSARLDIWTIDRSGQNPVAVTTDGARNSNPVWGPGGRHLYFVSSRGGPINLWRVPIDETSGRTSGPPEAITTPSPFVAHISISKDGTQIAYSSILRSRNIQKLRIDPASGRPRGEPIWFTTGSRLWANPDPSPDGKWVVFYSGVQPEGDLYLARTDGKGGLQQLTGTDAIDRMPRWSPDAQWIAFHSIRDKDQYLWKIRPDGSDRQQLSPLADAIYPAWEPNGPRMAVLMGAGIGHPENNVYVLDPSRPWTDQKPEIIPPPAGSKDEFVVNAWSPDGTRLAGQAGLAGDRGILTYSLRSRSFDRLTDFGGYPVWLPDSRRVLFVAGGRAFYVVDTRTRKVEQVFSVQRDIIGPPQLTKDGEEAYFTRRVTEGDIWLMTASAPEPTP
jgi:Tol biopolymer transport system component